MYLPNSKGNQLLIARSGIKAQFDSTNSRRGKKGLKHSRDKNGVENP